VPIGFFLMGRYLLSKARVASDLRRQFAKEAGDRGPDASGEVSIAGFRGVLELGLSVVDLADNLVFFGREFDANHKMGVSGAGPGEPENHDRVIVRKVQAGGRQALLYGSTESLQRGRFQAMKEHVGGHGDVVRRERDRSAVKWFGAVHIWFLLSTCASASIEHDLTQQHDALFGAAIGSQQEDSVFVPLEFRHGTDLCAGETPPSPP
jgi:hypothetical protein